jgi:acetylornithine deacetylase/succinyl-diaminopimelate desuccinylase-like protein
MVHLLASMKNAAGEITIEGLHDPIVAPTEQERAAAAVLPIDPERFPTEHGMAELDAPKDRAFFERLMFYPTLTVNGLHGGYGGPGVKTVLPCEAVAKCDIRLVEAMTPEFVFEKVAAHVQRHAPDVELAGC